MPPFAPANYKKAVHMNHRYGTADDLNLLAEWNRQLIIDENHRNAMSTRQLRERMKKWLENNYKVVIFNLDSDPIAYALYSEVNREIYLRQLFVNRRYRRQGFGKQAVCILRKQIWPPDKRLTVEVLTANRPAIEFWRSVGYTDYCLTLEVMPKKYQE